MKRAWRLMLWDGKRYQIADSGASRFEARSPMDAIKISGLDDLQYSIQYSRVGFGYFTGRIFIRLPETVSAGDRLPADFIIEVLPEAIERMVINYYIQGSITEEQSAKLCDFIDNTIGGGHFPKPGEHRGRAVIPFPTAYTGAEASADDKPKQEEPQEPPIKPQEIYAPYGVPLPEGVKDFREALQRDGLVLICYQKLAGREGTFFDALWAQSGTSKRCTNWSGAVREENIPYVIPLDAIDDNYKYRDL